MAKRCLANWGRFRSLRKSGNAEQIEAAREVVRKQLADEQQKRSNALRAGANRYEQLLSLDTEAMDALYNDLKERSRRLKADHAKPDFKHWARMDAWTIEEGLCLAFSIKPGILGEAIPPTLELPGEKYVSFFSSHFSAEVLLGKELAHEFSSACELAERSFGKAEFKRKAYPPEDFLCWAERKRIQICTELMEAAKDHQRHIKMMLCKLEELRDANERIKELEATISKSVGETSQSDKSSGARETTQKPYPPGLRLNDARFKTLREIILPDLGYNPDNMPDESGGGTSGALSKVWARISALRSRDSDWESLFSVEDTTFKKDLWLKFKIWNNEQN